MVQVWELCGGKEKAISMLKEAGFVNVQVKILPHDFQNYYYCAYKMETESMIDSHDTRNPV